ncbi:MAG TPA: anti-sigma factor [Steroidobacteraceae bacterium]|jgi:anti-sigma-K factor RskA|nr:anti-sigma factor [Steroidobacteraceae bacterium]
MSDLTSKPGGDEDAIEPPDDDLLAGEYVLGVLDEGQRRAVQVRIEAEPVFARRVAGWEERLGSLTAHVEPIDVPEHLWLRVRERLGWPAAAHAGGGLWRSVGFWRATTAVALAAAIAAIVISVPRMLAPPSPLVAESPAAEPVTTLSHDDGTPAWLASVDVRRGTVLLVPVPAPADARGRVPELWLIPRGGSPRALGLLSSDRSYAVAVPADLRIALTAGAVLAVSLEPPGGAPGPAPTGPIIAKGMIQL